MGNVGQVLGEELREQVTRLINLADAGDLVALPVKGISRLFEGVDLDDMVHTFEFHMVSNYLPGVPETCRRFEVGWSAAGW